jgi:hypothetical protein
MPDNLSPKSPPDKGRRARVLTLVALVVLLVGGRWAIRYGVRQAGASVVARVRSAMQHPGAHAAGKSQVAQAHAAAQPARPAASQAGMSSGGGSALSPIIAAKNAQAREAAHAATVNAAAGVRPAISRASLVPAVPASPVPARAQAAQSRASESDADRIEVSPPDEGIDLVHPKVSQYTYDPDGRRDPFQSLLKGEFEYTRDAEGQPLVDIGDLRLMGVATANNQYYAMVEDSKKHGFTLRVGDPVLNGRVTQIQPDCITVNLSSYGETQMVKLHLSATPTNTSTRK